MQTYSIPSNREQKKGDDMADVENVKQLARTFAAEIPDKTLSPAEIQGFLMSWKNRPADACAATKQWIAEIMARNKI